MIIVFVFVIGRDVMVISVVFFCGHSCERHDVVVIGVLFFLFFFLVVFFLFIIDEWDVGLVIVVWIERGIVRVELIIVGNFITKSVIKMRPSWAKLLPARRSTC